MRTPRTAPTRVAVLVRLRATTLAVAALAVLAATIAPSPANAQATADPTPQHVNDVLPARALPPVPAADAATFCPRPTGHWWDDVTTHGCTELLAGRDHTTPITPRELAWLDLGGLPAYPTIDIDAIDTAIATYTQRLADEAAAEEAARAADEAAEQRPPRTPQPPRNPGGFRHGAIDTVAVSAACGHEFGTAPTPEQDACIRAAIASGGPSSAPTPTPTSEPEQSGADRESYFHGLCLDRVPSPPDSALPNGPERKNHARAVAECVDREIPGYMTTWLQREAERAAWFEEARRKEQEAIARMQARRDAAIAEARATCPGAWTVESPFGMIGSYDEVEFTVTCH